MSAFLASKVESLHYSQGEPITEGGSYRLTEPTDGKGVAPLT